MSLESFLHHRWKQKLQRMNQIGVSTECPENLLCLPVRSCLLKNRIWSGFSESMAWRIPASQNLLGHLPLCFQPNQVKISVFSDIMDCSHIKHNQDVTYDSFNQTRDHSSKD
uniref:Uncharacterized protein LOC107417253 n=1 Tax=Rhizophora mucronata TaxID=61149 RepID=A0A2P2IKQ8_RHIMU